MKNLLLFFALIVGLISTQAQDNPFAEYGYTPKVATLSQGQFNESFDNDTIVQIGSVLFNTKSKQIVAFVEYDTLYSEATLEPDIVSRWMSPDPLASHYTSLSPYHFTNNNPILNVEVDGRYFTGNTASVKAIYAIVSQLDGERASAFKAALEKMDASDVEFHVQNTVQPSWYVGTGKGGNTTFDVENNRVVIDVFQFGSGTEHHISKEARMGHELEHGSQFLKGEISFKGSGPDFLFYDQSDEEKAIQIENMISNTQLGPTDRIKTDEDASRRAKLNYDMPNKEETTISPEQAEQFKNSSQTTRTSIYNYKPNEKQKEEKKSILK